MSRAELIHLARSSRPCVVPLSRRPFLVRFVSSAMSSLVQRWAVGSRMVRLTTSEHMERGVTHSGCLDLSLLRCRCCCSRADERRHRLIRRQLTTFLLASAVTLMPQPECKVMAVLASADTGAQTARLGCMRLQQRCAPCRSGRSAFPLFDLCSRSSVGHCLCSSAALISCCVWFSPCTAWLPCSSR